MEDPTSDWGDEPFLEDDDELEEGEGGNAGDENALKGVNESSRPTTRKSVSPTLQNEEKRPRIKAPRATLYSFGNVVQRRDPVIDSLIESRKFSIIENPYTRLAQVTSQETRLPQKNIPDIRPSTGDEGDEEYERSSTSQGRRRIVIPKASELENQGWDDGLPIEPDMGKRKLIS